MKTGNEKFIGTWELKEWTAELNDGRILFPAGENVTGQLTYDAKGRMAVQIMKNNRPPFVSEDPIQAQPDEMIAAYNGFIAYCGNYEVDLNANQVIHHIKISFFPNWVGQNQIRNFEFQENLLILSTTVIGSGKHKLIWIKDEE
jgi:Lipocalin-like domain